MDVLNKIYKKTYQHNTHDILLDNEVTRYSFWHWWIFQDSFFEQKSKICHEHNVDFSGIFSLIFQMFEKSTTIKDQSDMTATYLYDTLENANN